MPSQGGETLRMSIRMNKEYSNDLIQDWSVFKYGDHFKGFVLQMKVYPLLTTTVLYSVSLLVVNRIKPASTTACVMKTVLNKLKIL